MGYGKMSMFESNLKHPVYVWYDANTIAITVGRAKHTNWDEYEKVKDRTSNYLMKYRGFKGMVVPLANIPTTAFSAPKKVIFNNQPSDRVGFLVNYGILDGNKHLSFNNNGNVIEELKQLNQENDELRKINYQMARRLNETTGDERGFQGLYRIKKSIAKLYPEQQMGGYGLGRYGYGGYGSSYGGLSGYGGGNRTEDSENEE